VKNHISFSAFDSRLSADTRTISQASQGLQ